MAWHGLDVAAAFLELLKIWPDEEQALAACFEGAWEVAKRALASLIALHDIGKFAPAFQGKVPACAPSELLPMPTGLSIDHGATGMAYFNDLRFLRPIADVLLAAMQSDERWIVFQPVFGHHGKPLDNVKLDPARDGHSEEPFVAAARHCVTDVMALYANPVLPPVRKGASTALSWRLAGLIALSDWIGSSDIHSQSIPRASGPVV
jgi:CRISPR-associated endonuclease/helicase Cas3